MTITRRRTVKQPRPAGSWELAIARAREAWDALIADGYSETAATAILRVAPWLWADAAALSEVDGTVQQAGRYR